MYPLDRPKRYKTLVLSGRCSLRPPGSRHNHRGWMMSHSPAPSCPLDSPCNRQSLCGGVKSRRCLKRRTHIEVLVNMCVSPTLELRGNASYDVGVYTWSACWHGLGSNNQIRIRPFGSPRPQQRAMHVCTSHHTKFCPKLAMFNSGQSEPPKNKCLTPYLSDMRYTVLRWSDLAHRCSARRGIRRILEAWLSRSTRTTRHRFLWGTSAGYTTLVQWRPGTPRRPRSRYTLQGCSPTHWSSLSCPRGIPDNERRLCDRLPSHTFQGHTDCKAGRS